MRSGQLRHRITLERPRQTDVSAQGQSVEVWEEVGRFWAAVEPLSARQFVSGDQQRGETTHTVRIRWIDGVTLRDRIDFNGRKLNIASVINPDERNRELQLICVESHGD